MNPRTLRLALLALPAVLGAGWFWMSTAAPAPFARGTVVRVIDGDTILVRGGGGRIEDIRLLGIDTPETVDPRKPVEYLQCAHTARTLGVGNLGVAAWRSYGVVATFA